MARSVSGRAETTTQMADLVPFHQRPDRRDTWYYNLSTGFHKLLYQGTGSFEQLYSSCYNLVLHGHKDDVEDLVVEYGCLIGGMFGSSPLWKQERENMIQLFCDVCSYLDRPLKSKKLRSCAAVRPTLELYAKYRNLKNRRRWQLYGKIVGALACLGRRAAERQFAPGGEGALEAAKEFESLAGSAERPAKRARVGARQLAPGGKWP
eukprot:431095-Prymnesium_polylepis.2